MMERVKAVNYFGKTLHLRRFKGFKIYLLPMASYQDPTQIFGWARLRFPMFLLDVIFVLLTLHH